MLKRFSRLKHQLLNNASRPYEMQLPNFFIIGANKAGTTSLYYYCKQHPEIFMSQNKEPMFFLSMNPPRIKKEEAAVGKPYSYFTLREYMGLFAAATEPMRGESSTAYLAVPTSVLWIKKIIPHAKLIAILRNPIERAISDYEYHYKGKVDGRSFAQAITDAFNFIKDQKSSRQATENKPMIGNPLVGARYLNVGRYGSQLSVVKQYFTDDQLFVADYEELNRDSIEFMQKIYKFLGVGKFTLPNVKRLNTSGKSSHQIDKSIENKMKEFFEEDIKLLQTLVNFDVMKWLQ